MIKINPVFIDFKKNKPNGPDVLKDMSYYIDQYITPELDPSLNGIIQEVTITVTKQTYDLKVSCKAMFKDKEIVVHEEGKDFYVVVMRCAKTFKKQVFKNQSKYITKKKSNRQKSKDILKEISIKAFDSIEDYEKFKTFIIEDNEDDFLLKPMSVEEALIQLQISEKEFFVFIDEESNKLQVIYPLKSDSDSTKKVFKIVSPNF